MWSQHYGGVSDFGERMRALDPAAIEQQGMAPLLYARSGDPALRHAALRAAALEPLRLADLRALLDALAAHGVVPLIVKGTALAYSLYEAPELRPRADTDLLLAADELGRAREAFHELGCVEQLSSGNMSQTMFRRVDSAGADHVYDVHWAIANTPVFADVLRIDELRARSVPLPRIGAHARTIADVDALLYACVHRIAHHHDDERLIWLADIHFLIERMSDGELARFWALAKEREGVGVCMRSVERAEEWFGGSGRVREFLDEGTITRAEKTRSYLGNRPRRLRSEEHTSELQSRGLISYAVF